MNDENLVDMSFPVKGIDVSMEYSRQPDRTCAVGENVRSYEPGECRARGGARPGLSRYIEEQVTFGSWVAEDPVTDDDHSEKLVSVIQHLNVVVDPTVDAVLANFDTDGDADPSTSNRRRRTPSFATRRVRTGGSARRPRRNTPKTLLTITANDRTKDYGTALSLGTSEFTATGLTNGDTVTSVTLNSRGAAATADVPPSGQTYRIIPSAAVISGTEPAEGFGRKYRIRYVPGALTVNKVPLTITANNRTKAYGDAVTFAGTEVSTSGLVVSNGDLVRRVRLESAGAAADAPISGSPYTINAYGARGRGLSNYLITYVPGSLTISSVSIAFVQSRSTLAETGAATTNLSFNSNVTAGNLLLIVAATRVNILGSVSDSLGNSWTLAVSRLSGLGSYAIWYAVSWMTGACEVTFSWSGTSTAALAILEYSGVATSPLDSTVTNLNASGGTWSSGSIPVSAAGRMVICGVGENSWDLSAVTLASDSGFNTRENRTQLSPPLSLIVADKLGLSSATAITGTVSPSLTTSAVGASFKPPT